MECVQVINLAIDRSAVNVFFLTLNVHSWSNLKLSSKSVMPPL